MLPKRDHRFRAASLITRDVIDFEKVIVSSRARTDLRQLLDGARSCWQQRRRRDDATQETKLRGWRTAGINPNTQAMDPNVERSALQRAS